MLLNRNDGQIWFCVRSKTPTHVSWILVTDMKQPNQAARMPTDSDNGAWWAHNILRDEIRETINHHFCSAVKLFNQKKIVENHCSPSYCQIISVSKFIRKFDLAFTDLTIYVFIQRERRSSAKGATQNRDRWLNIARYVHNIMSVHKIFGAFCFWERFWRWCGDSEVRSVGNINHKPWMSPFLFRRGVSAAVLR